MTGLHEVYAPSVTQRKNAEKLFDLIGYKLGWYTAARTEVTFTNNTDRTITLDFGFNGSNFCMLNAYTDITQQPRVITYNVLPLTNTYGYQDTRSKRQIVTEGILKKNNYIIKLPSQHLDTTAVWIKTKSSLHDDKFIDTQWNQVSSAAEFTVPKPRFSVTYDNYSNAQIQISNYLKQGDINTVDPKSNDLGISNLANTSEMPHTNTVTVKSPETAKEAYLSSRNYINTWDSLIPLHDFNRFLLREPGIDCGVVIDCQKAIEINLEIYKDKNLTEDQKSKMYITYHDFPQSPDKYKRFKWENILDIGFDPTAPDKFIFSANFKTYTAMCFPIYNEFNVSEYSETTYERVRKNTPAYKKVASSNANYDYAFIGYQILGDVKNAIIADYKPLQAMSVELQFGFARIFSWYVVGEIYPRNPVDKTTADNIISRVKEALAIYFSPANRKFGQKPTIMEVVEIIESADSRIRYFDAGSLKYPVINWGELERVGMQEILVKYDIEYFNPISFARYQDLGFNLGIKRSNIRIAPDWLID